jgi:hypothetical protein
MLNVNVRANRTVLAAATGIAVTVLDEYRPALVELDVIDDGGEDCGVCQVDGAVVEVNWYGKTESHGEDVTGQCCRGCVDRALTLADVYVDGPTTLEYLPLDAS